MVSEEHGNLMQQANIYRLVAAGFAGAPCETWSVARLEEVEVNRAPRLLRELLKPMGQAGCRHARRQAAGCRHKVGTRHCARHGSIWKTQVIRWLREARRSSFSN